MDISVVIPLYNEAESLPELFSWIERVMKEHNYTYEVIFVNDGSTDNSWEVIEELKQRSPHVLCWIYTDTRDMPPMRGAVMTMAGCKVDRMSIYFLPMLMSKD